MEILVEDTLVSAGQFPGALILLPSIEGLADAVTRLRNGERTVEVCLVGDTVTTWFVERKRRGAMGLSVVCRDVDTAIVSASELDTSCKEAVDIILMRLQVQLFALRDHPDVVAMLDIVESAWPESRFVASIREFRSFDSRRDRRSR